jgi:hypothetical protein
MKIATRSEYQIVMLLANATQAPERQKEALKIALEERAREIELYWKRTAYSWTLNAAAFAGYFALANGKATEVRHDLLAVVSCLGIACSASWYAINRGSKYWQENWEVQVDLLELEVAGPLHRVNPDQHGYKLARLNQAYPFSVSKVNQLLSLFVLLTWLILASDAAARLDWSLTRGSPVVSVVVAMVLVFCWLLPSCARTTPFANVIGRSIWLKNAPIDEAGDAV